VILEGSVRKTTGRLPSVSAGRGEVGDHRTRLLASSLWRDCASVYTLFALLGAAIARWPLGYIRAGNHVLTGLTLYAFLFLLIGYDLWSTHKVHRATLWGSL
jgi:hypothetical protein